MRIISDFHDYYDSAMAFGHDPNVIYERRASEVVTGVLKNDKTVQTYLWMNPVLNVRSQPIHLKNGMYITCEPISIFFCGKLYVGLRFSKSIGMLPGFSKNTETFFSIDAINSFLAKFGLEPNVIEGGYRYYFNKQESYKIGVHESEALMNKAIETREVSLVFINHGTYHQNITIIRNPRLKDYDFYRIRDSYQAFQDIDMFVSGILTPENKPLTVIADKYKRDEHGFDEWSFKKLPSGKKK